MPKSQPPKLKATVLYKIFQFLKQVLSAMLHADSDLVIFMELKRKVVQKFTSSLGWTKMK